MKTAGARLQVKQRASRCEAVEVALMNDLLLGAVATSLASCLTLRPLDPPPPTPVTAPIEVLSLEFFGWAAGICLAAALGSFGSCRKERWLGTRRAEYPGTAWLGTWTDLYVGYMSAISASRYVPYAPAPAAPRQRATACGRHTGRPHRADSSFQLPASQLPASTSRRHTTSLLDTRASACDIPL